MLTSFSGVGDTAAPVSGAAHHARAAAAAKTGGAGADFASAMQGAEGAEDTQTSPDGASPEAADPQNQTRGTRAAHGHARTHGNAPLTRGDLAGFYRSMRAQAFAADDSSAPSSDKTQDATTDTKQGDAGAASDASNVTPVVVVVTEPMLTRALPIMVGDSGVDQGEAEAQTSQATVANVIDAAMSGTANPAETPVAVATKTEVDASVANQATATAMVETPVDSPLADATIAQLAQQMTGAEQGPAPAATPEAATKAAARLTPQGAAIARDLTARDASPADTTRIAATRDASSAPVATLAAAWQNAALNTSSGSATSANEPARADAAAAPAQAVARARVGAMTADAADKNSNTPKARTAAAFAEAIAPRVDRLSVASRLVPPVFLAPTLATPLVMTATGAVAMADHAGIGESQITDQIVQSMRMQFAQGGGEATIELNPNYLGKVQVAVRVEHGAVTASVQAETPAVREWIATHREELTQTLSQQGLRLEKLDIAETAKESSPRDTTRDPRQPQRDAHKPRRDERERTTDTFEHDLQENV